MTLAARAGTYLARVSSLSSSSRRRPREDGRQTLLPKRQRQHTTNLSAHWSSALACGRSLARGKPPVADATPCKRPLTRMHRDGPSRERPAALIAGATGDQERLPCSA